MPPSNLFLSDHAFSLPLISHSAFFPLSDHFFPLDQYTLPIILFYLISDQFQVRSVYPPISFLSFVMFCFSASCPCFDQFVIPLPLIRIPITFIILLFRPIFHQLIIPSDQFWLSVSTFRREGQFRALSFRPSTQPKSTPWHNPTSDCPRRPRFVSRPMDPQVPMKETDEHRQMRRIAFVAVVVSTVSKWG